MLRMPSIRKLLRNIRQYRTYKTRREYILQSLEKYLRKDVIPKIHTIYVISWERDGCIIAVSYQNITKFFEFSNWFEAHCFVLYLSFVTNIDVYHNDSIVCDIKPCLPYIDVEDPILYRIIPPILKVSLDYALDHLYELGQISVEVLSYQDRYFVAVSVADEIQCAFPMSSFWSSFFTCKLAHMYGNYRLSYAYRGKAKDRVVLSRHRSES